MKVISDKDYNRLIGLAETLPVIKDEIKNMFKDLNDTYIGVAYIDKCVRLRCDWLMLDVKARDLYEGFEDYAKRHWNDKEYQMKDTPSIDDQCPNDEVLRKALNIAIDEIVERSFKEEDLIGYLRTCYYGDTSIIDTIKNKWNDEDK